MAAPLVGTLNSGGSFNQFASLLDLKQSDVAFSWSSTGDGNKIEAGNIAEIRLADKDNADWIMTPIITQSTLNGDWVTKLSSQFGNGDYSAFMQQYRPTDYDLNNPVDSATVAVDFSVNLDTLGLVSADGGTALGLTAGGSTTAGNWIQLNATSSTLPNGTLIAYATDASGNMIARDGSITTSLDAAALGRIGSVASDSGATFFSGEQSIYLPVGQELHFAIVAGNGVVDTNPTVNVTGSGPTLGVSVSDSFGRINLTAQVDNTLSEIGDPGGQPAADRSRLDLSHPERAGRRQPRLERRLREHAAFRSHRRQSCGCNAVAGGWCRLRQYRCFPQCRAEQLGIHVDPGSLYRYRQRGLERTGR